MMEKDRKVFYKICQSEDEYNILDKAMHHYKMNKKMTRNKSENKRSKKVYAKDCIKIQFKNGKIIKVINFAR